MILFCGKTDEELSLVCLTKDVPAAAEPRDDGWKAFRIQGVLDFSLMGILSKLSGILAENHIGIFAVSTYNTDYILVKKENFTRPWTFWRGRLPDSVASAYGQQKRKNSLRST